MYRWPTDHDGAGWRYLPLRPTGSLEGDYAGLCALLIDCQDAISTQPPTGLARFDVVVAAERVLQVAMVAEVLGVIEAHEARARDSGLDLAGPAD